MKITISYQPEHCQTTLCNLVWHHWILTWHVFHWDTVCKNSKHTLNRLLTFGTCSEEVITILFVCTCVLQVYTPLRAFMQLDGYIDWLHTKSRRFSTYKFLYNHFFQEFLLIFHLLAFTGTIHVLIAHACVLTSCTCDINPTSTMPAQQC